MKVRASVMSLGIAAVLAAAPVHGQAQAKNQPMTAQLQGFNIVLVLGETQPGGPAPTEELPAGARKALADMSEFLPYKHYRVLDAQWISCCAGAPSLSGRLRGVVGIPGPKGEVNVVHRVFDFTLSVTGWSAEHLPVRFTLGLHDSAPRGHAVDATEQEQRRANLQEDLRTMAARLSETQRRVKAGVESAVTLREAEDRYIQVEQELDAVKARLAAAAGAGSSPIIDSSFTMDAGETVVVGTSRLGGDKALIALVTAVRRTGSKD
jgi:hypothetical protein